MRFPVAGLGLYVARSRGRPGYRRAVAGRRRSNRPGHRDHQLLQQRRVPVMRILNPLLTGVVLICLSVVLRPAELSAQAQEGVTLRGHWVIEVRNPDGTLVTRREFDNALT